jgi:plasmid stabilization system protein ParE
MAELNWTSEAERWLRDIYDYIAADSPLAATRVVEGIFEKAQVLTEFPDIGYKYEGTAREVRILLYGHYRITYVRRQDSNIDIIGVFHGALDIDRYLV